MFFGVRKVPILAYFTLLESCSYPIQVHSVIDGNIEENNNQIPCMKGEDERVKVFFKPENRKQRVCSISRKRVKRGHKNIFYIQGKEYHSVRKIGEIEVRGMHN